MRCILMNKNVPVVEVELDDDTATILKVMKNYELDFLPIGIDVVVWQMYSCKQIRNHTCIGATGGSIFGAATAKMLWAEPLGPILDETCGQ